MNSKGLIKRFVPFLLTFAVGLFIASFFVSIASPFGGRFRRMQKFRELQELRIENKQLRDDNCRMRKQLEALKRDSVKGADTQVNVIPLVERDAPPPPPPKAPRPPRR